MVDAKMVDTERNAVYSELVSIMSSPYFNPWAKRLGMLVVPMFSPMRAKNFPDEEHVVFLDGHASSLTVSFGNESTLNESSKIRSWAWSANLLHSMIVDKSSERFYLFRSNTTSPIQEGKLSDSKIVEEIIEATINEQDDTDNVVRKALDLFRNIRTEIESCAGSESDTIRAFNCTLSWADMSQRQLLRSVKNVPQTFSDVVNLLSETQSIRYEVCDLSPSVRQFPMAEFGGMLLDLGGKNHVLDVDVLLRHASGEIFQDAHIQLSKRQGVQAHLFHIPQEKPTRPAGRLKKDAHFTPPSLARLLAQSALEEHCRINPNATSLNVLDPACGSGVFLIETIRELCDSDMPLCVRGYDTSSAACLMAEYGVERTLADHQFGHVEYDLSESDSLSLDTWDAPDIILMNPPFTPWRTMTPEQKESVTKSLGDLYSGKSDTAIAFVAKAIDELKPGAVLATVIPSAFLESESASHIRQWIAMDDSLNVRLIGRFRGYGYFREAIVEPAFIVISRSMTADTRNDIVVALANEGKEDKLIRELRKEPSPLVRNGSGWEISSHSPDLLFADKWTPRSTRALSAVAELRKNGCVPVTDLFDIKLGIRTGNNDAFIVRNDELELFARTPQSMAYFRPTADNIRRGSIVEKEHVFYPYDVYGECKIRTEKELSDAVPEFYRKRLWPLKEQLENRTSRRHRHWWELSEPRPTWLANTAPRIVSMTFSQHGAFAFDDTGTHAIVQGQAWIWKRESAFDNTDIPWAYIAILNSAEFESLLDLYCQRTQGGQYEVSKRYLRSVIIPDLSIAKPDIVESLARIGRQMHDGSFFQMESQGEATARAFGMSLSEFQGSFPPSKLAMAEYSFHRLSAKWKRETGHLSNVNKKMRHPAYVQIVEMGKAAVPLLIEDLRRTQSDWFWALSEITGDQPIPESDFGNIPKMTEAWVKWAAKRRD
ncbi:MAG: N-6 DNA methylase [Schlesneria sp.]